ncbi:MAG: hypothetical protein PHS64_00305 [Candidatus Omnitrophica bacterium]|nr:hypothetical protein [Candidatus Omnitrophota bacterium]
MADSKRQQIVDKIKARFGAILQENGYATDIGKNVYFWRTVALGQNNLPAIICRDRLRTDWGTIGAWDRYLDVEIEMYLKPDISGDFDGADYVMRQVLADLETAVGSDVKWDDLAEDTHVIENPEIDIAARDNVYVAALARMTVEYQTLPWNPYQ